MGSGFFCEIPLMEQFIRLPDTCAVIQAELLAIRNYGDNQERTHGKEVFTDDDEFGFCNDICRKKSEFLFKDLQKSQAETQTTTSHQQYDIGVEIKMSYVVCRKMKLKIYNTLNISENIYGVEWWTLSAADRHIQAI